MKSPTLYVLARPQITQDYEKFLATEGQTWFLSGGSGAERLVEFAGRICYMSFGERQSPKENVEYIRNLVRQNHESVLEHASWTFLLTSVSRAFTHQLVRHRIGMSFSQLSQQYHDESDANFIAPEGIQEDIELFEVWKSAVESSARAYKAISLKLASASRGSKEKIRAIRSEARSVLPNAIETKIVVTGNARSLRHFLEVRGCIVGDIEMRRVSKLIYEMIFNDAPSCVFDFRCSVLADGSPLIEKVTSVKGAS